MVREFKLPDVGEGLTEAEIVAWHVEPGDSVSEDQIVAEVETDKAVVEIPSPVDGTVKEILAEPGEMVAVGEVIITFEVAGESEETTTPTTAVEGKSDATPEDHQSQSDEGETTTIDPADGPAPGRVFAAPSARRLARELDVDISSISGSGPGGRVTTGDVRSAAEATPAAADVAGGDIEERADETAHPGTGPDTHTPDAAGGLADEAGTTARDRTLAAPATRRLAEELAVDIDAVPAVEERDGMAYVSPEAVEAFAESDGPAPREAAETPTGSGQPTDRVERVSYRGVRRTVGQQMERSAFTAPHVTHHDEVDVTALVDLREQLRAAAADRGQHLTYLPFVIRAVTAALREYPYLNAELDEEAEEILLKHYCNIGVATATDAGLMVPVVEGADQLSLLELAAAISDLTQRARDRTITREEMQGGTFTITNFGAIGGRYATPIINYPEVAILGLGAIEERPRVVDGEVVPRDVLTLSLSIDHRVVDGAVAAQFVNAVKTSLEEPEILLLE